MNIILFILSVCLMIVGTYLVIRDISIYISKLNIRSSEIDYPLPSPPLLKNEMPELQKIKESFFNKEIPNNEFVNRLKITFNNLEKNITQKELEINKLKKIKNNLLAANKMLLDSSLSNSDQVKENISHNNNTIKNIERVLRHYTNERAMILNYLKSFFESLNADNNIKSLKNIDKKQEEYLSTIKYYANLFHQYSKG